MAISAALQWCWARAWHRWRCGGCSAHTGAVSSSVVCGPRRGPRARCFLLALPVLLWQPWSTLADDTQEAQREWEPLELVHGRVSRSPPEAMAIEIRTSPTTLQTQRLIQSAVDTYEKSKDFYDDAEAAAADLDLREPGEDETVAVVVSDRHDNVGMDRVARAIGDPGRSDSSGPRCRGRHLDRTAVGGVQPRLARPLLPGPRSHRSDWQPRQRPLRGRLPRRARMDDARWVAGGGAMGRLNSLGVGDPRSSGSATGATRADLSFSEGSKRASWLRRLATAIGPRPILVHDANLGREALGPRLRRPRRSAVTRTSRTDPTAVEGENGATGYALHQRHDRGSGLRHRRRKQAATRRLRHAHHLRGRPPRWAPRRCACEPMGCSWSSPTSSSTSLGVDSEVVADVEGAATEESVEGGVWMVGPVRSPAIRMFAQVWAPE